MCNSHVDTTKHEKAAKNMFVVARTLYFLYQFTEGSDEVSLFEFA